MQAGTAQAATGLVEYAGDTYWLSQDNHRYLFPGQDDALKSWSLEQTPKKAVSASELASYPFGGIVRFRPGAKPTAVASGNQRYVVARGSVLRPVNDSKLLAQLYPTAGELPKIAVAQFANYAIGAPVMSAQDFDPAKEAEGIATPDDNPPFVPIATRSAAVTKTFQGNLHVNMTMLNDGTSVASAVITDANSPSQSLSIELVDEHNIRLKLCQFSNECALELVGGAAQTQTVTAKATNELGQTIISAPQPAL